MIYHPDKKLTYIEAMIVLMDIRLNQKVYKFEQSLKKQIYWLDNGIDPNIELNKIIKSLKP